MEVIPSLASDPSHGGKNHPKILSRLSGMLEAGYATAGPAMGAGRLAARGRQGREKGGKRRAGAARVGLPNPTARQLPRNAQRNARRGVRWKKLNGGHDVTGVLDIT